MGACCKAPNGGSPALEKLSNETWGVNPKAKEAVEREAKVEAASDTSGYTTLGAVKWMQGDLLSYLKFGYCAAPEEFKRVFSDAGIAVNNVQDLDVLNNLYITGKDLDGSIKRPDGSPLVFSVTETVGKMYISPKTVRACKVRFAGIEDVKDMNTKEI